MRICKHCGNTFYPLQSFQALFHPPSACTICVAMLKTPLRSEHLPLYQNTLVLLTHDHPAHPALTDDLFERAIVKDVPVLFHESLKQADAVGWSLLSSLLEPLVLYYPDYPAFDVLERLLERFDNEMKFSHVSLE
ncbi:MAG: hypothetical protein ACOC2X_03225 [Bacillota bacterium]